MIEETEYLKVIKALVVTSSKDIKWIVPILLTIASYFGLQQYLSKILLVFFSAFFFIFTLFFLMIRLAAKEIKEKNEKITPSIPEIFKREPKDVIIKNFKEIVDIKNLKGDCNTIVEQEIVRSSGEKIAHWQFLVGNSNIPGNLNIEAYKIDNGRPITDCPLKVEPYLKQKNLQVFRIYFLSSEQAQKFMIKYSLNRVLPEMLTVGEWVSMDFTRQVEKYEFEIKLPNEVQEIKKCCVTKTGSRGEITENGCFSINDGGNLVPLKETCFPPTNEIKGELNLNVPESGGRKILSLRSNSGLNQDESVRIWWICSKRAEE